MVETRPNDYVLSPTGYSRRWLFSANDFSISRLNTGRSSGLRLVVIRPSCTTSSSTQSPPALRISVRSEVHEVNLLILRDVGFDQQPGTVTNRGDRFAAIEKRPHKFHRFGNGAKRIWIRYSTRQHQRIVRLIGEVEYSRLLNRVVRSTMTRNGFEVSAMSSSAYEMNGNFTKAFSRTLVYWKLNRTCTPNTRIRSRSARPESFSPGPLTLILGAEIDAAESWHRIHLRHRSIEHANHIGIPIDRSTIASISEVAF